MSKTHYKTDDTKTAVCNRNKNQKKLTFNASEVTCEKCKATNIWKDDISIEESKRVASSGELGKDNMCIENLSQNELNKLISFCGDNNISHSISRSEGRITLLNVAPKQMMRIRSFIQNGCRDIEEKTQLELDKEKYNLSDEIVEYLKDIDYEVINSFNDCEGCIFDTSKIGCGSLDVSNSSINCGSSSQNHSIIFKQINKKEESLNEPNVGVDAPQLPTDITIDAPTIRKPIKEPKTWIDETVEHYYENMSKKPTHPSFDKCVFKPVIKEPKYNPDNVAFKKELPSKYHREYYSMSENKSVVLDVYDKLAVMDLPNAEIEHTYKKLDRCGKGDKSLLEDLREAREQLDMGIKRIEKDLEV